jgi:hypothetical protein
VLFDLGVYPNAPSSMRYSQQTAVTHVPLSAEVQEFTPEYRQMEREREITQNCELLFWEVWILSLRGAKILR